MISEAFIVKLQQLYFSFRRSPSERKGQTLCVRFLSAELAPPYSDAERPRLAFPRGAWEREGFGEDAKQKSI